MNKFSINEQSGRFYISDCWDACHERASYLHSDLEWRSSTYYKGQYLGWYNDRQSAYDTLINWMIKQGISPRNVSWAERKDRVYVENAA